MQLYIKQVDKHGGIISRSIAISVAKVLLERGKSFGMIKITERWVKSLPKRMGMLEGQTRNRPLKVLMVQEKKWKISICTTS